MKSEKRKVKSEKLRIFRNLLLCTILYPLSTVICSAAAPEAGTMSAERISLAGTNIIDGTFISALFIGIASIISAVGGVVWANHRNARKRPLDSGDLFVTCQQCADHRNAIAQRIDALGPALERIFRRLRENDEKDEARICSVQRRIDPLIERVAANTTAIEMLKGKREV